MANFYQDPWDSLFFFNDLGRLRLTRRGSDTPNSPPNPNRTYYMGLVRRFSENVSVWCVCACVCVCAGYRVCLLSWEKPTWKLWPTWRLPSTILMTKRSIRYPTTPKISSRSCSLKITSMLTCNNIILCLQSYYKPMLIYSCCSALYNVMNYILKLWLKRADNFF